MRTISASSAETGDLLQGARPRFDALMPFTGDRVVVHCRETGSLFDGQVVVAEHLVYSVMVGEKRSGRFRRRKRQPVAKASGPSNAERGEETRWRILELLKANGGSMPAPEMARELGITPDAIRYHINRWLAGLVFRSDDAGPNNCTVWKLAA